MPIAFASSASTEHSSVVTAITIAVPSGTSNGDLLMAAITFANGTETITPPAGWTTLSDFTDGGAGSAGTRFATYYRVASGEPANYTWNFSGTGVQTAGVMWRITGANTTTPLNANSNKFGTGANISASAITVTVFDSLLCFLAAFVSDAAGISFNVPSTFTLRNQLTSAGGSQLFGVTKILAGTGSVATATTANAATAGDRWISQFFAFAPASTTADDRVSGTTHCPMDMTLFRVESVPIGALGGFGFLNKDGTAPFLLASPAANEFELPFEYTIPPPDGAYPSYIFEIVKPDNVVDPPAPPHTSTGSIGPRISLLPGTLPDDQQWKRQAAAWMAEANQGHLQNTGVVTLADHQSQTVVLDDRVGVNSFISFMPRTANASQEISGGQMYVTTGKKTFIITHANNAQTDRTFVYSIMGG